jgi:hypothetical protein
MTVLIRTFAIAAGMALSVASGVPALAGGDDYDSMADAEGKGPAYFGFVRDMRGSAVSNAKVVLRPKEGEPVVIQSNAIGLYRSHISKDVRPDQVEISCEKDGYKQARVVRRSTQGAANVETNCMLQRL